MNRHQIVVVEDNLVTQDVMRYVLTGSGFDVLTADDGEQALRILDENTPDLLITDCQMPGISGLEVCRRIREQSRFRSLPVIVCTAKGYELDHEQLKQLQIADIVFKPFSPMQLVSTVKRILKAGHCAQLSDSIKNQRGRPVTI